MSLKSVHFSGHLGLKLSTACVWRQMMYTRLQQLINSRHMARIPTLFLIQINSSVFSLCVQQQNSNDPRNKLHTVSALGNGLHLFSSSDCTVALRWPEVFAWGLVEKQLQKRLTRDIQNTLAFLCLILKCEFLLGHASCSTVYFICFLVLL